MTCRPCSPGCTCEGGGAWTGGVKRFGAFGSIRGAFSVGETGAAGDVVVDVVVVVEVSGAFSSSLAHPAVIMPIAAIAPNPATARKTTRQTTLCPHYLSLSVYLH